MHTHEVLAQTVQDVDVAPVTGLCLFVLGQMDLQNQLVDIRQIIYREITQSLPLGPLNIHLYYNRFVLVALRFDLVIQGRKIVAIDCLYLLSHAFLLVKGLGCRGVATLLLEDLEALEQVVGNAELTAHSAAEAVISFQAQVEQGRGVIEDV